MFGPKFSPYPLKRAEIHKSTYLISTYITIIQIHDKYNDYTADNNGYSLNTKIYHMYTKIA